MYRFIESLENRSLLSATLLPAVSTEVAADLALVAQAKANLIADTATWNKNVVDARANIAATRNAGLATLRADRAQIVADRGSPLKVSVDRGVLKTDTADVRIANFNAVHAVNSVIGQKISALATDRGAIRAAVRQLHVDRIKFPG